MKKLHELPARKTVKVDGIPMSRLPLNRLESKKICNCSAADDNPYTE